MEKKAISEKIIEYLNKIEDKLLSQISVDSKKIVSLLDKKKKYQKMSLLQNEYSELAEQVVSLDEKKVVQSEIDNLESQKEQLITQIKTELIREEGIEQNVIMEIRPGTGGDEAGLWASDLFHMYSKFAEKKKWKVEMIGSKIGKTGNFIFLAFAIRGENVFDCLRNEAGVHRVQRVPQTERYGRTHTSTATVAVLPEIKEISLNINPQQLKYDTYRSSGAGGQHVNTTDSAVRVTYVYYNNGKTETIIATSQDERSQHNNKLKALSVLKSRLWEKLQFDKKKEIESLRSEMIGTAERSEKFRNYNFKENRVTDARLKIKITDKIESIMEGDLEEICQKSFDYQIEKTLVKLVS